MKTKIVSMIIAFISLFASVFAWNLAWFIVSVDPSTVKKWEPVDLTVKAIDADGNIVEDYEWDIMISVKEWDTELSNNDYVVPNDWLYTFTKEDMWEKKFTKGLIINKEWNFKVSVQDFSSEDTWKEGETDIKVISKDLSPTWKVTITTPQEDETVNTSTVTVAWTAKNYANSKIQIFVDGEENIEWIVGDWWNYQVDLLNLSNWSHEIQVKVFDINNTVVAESDPVNITINSNKKIFKWITILPSSKVSKDTKVIVNVKVDSSVSSATLHVANYGDYPMDRKSLTEFTASFTANIPWTADMSLDLSVDSSKKTFNDVAQLTVVEKIAIQGVRFIRDNNKNTIQLNWKFTWEVPSFKVLYGTESWKYNKDNIMVKENKYTIKNIDESKTYFVKIVPVDLDWNKIWDESKEIVIEPNMQASATCKIDNIKTKVIVNKWKHYLTWDKVEWAVKYVVFKWEDETNLSKISELTWTQYEFPFDSNAKENKYAYFVVKAVCDDGTMQQIDKVKKVKVWPADWLLYALIIAIILYGLKLAVREN